eukprot:7391315-Prymnesium_polylepis.2
MLWAGPARATRGTRHRRHPVYYGDRPWLNRTPYQLWERHVGPEGRVLFCEARTGCRTVRMASLRDHVGYLTGSNFRRAHRRAVDESLRLVLFCEADASTVMVRSWPWHVVEVYTLRTQRCGGLALHRAYPGAPPAARVLPEQLATSPPAVETHAPHDCSQDSDVCAGATATAQRPIRDGREGRRAVQGVAGAQQAAGAGGSGRRVEARAAGARATAV